MSWVWPAVAVGAVVPWFMFGRDLRVAFRERGLQVGLGTWCGFATVTVPLTILFVWLGTLAIGAMR